jgi:hypothetical protein
VAASPKYLLADHILRDQGGLYPWVASWRTAGASWRTIGRELFQATDGQVDVTEQTLINWFPDLRVDA